MSAFDAAKHTGKAEFGLIGLAVMGENLALNVESRGFQVAVYNRTASKVDDFLKARAAGKNFIGAHTVEEFCKSLKKPRVCHLMVKAGKPVDDFIEQLLPHLEKGDIIIDGGNSHYDDTQRRVKYLEEKGLLFCGAGISGGEEGALNGPSIMPGGSEAAWKTLKPIFQGIAAKVGGDGALKKRKSIIGGLLGGKKSSNEGTPCCDWVGPEGSGHFVKMVHNGIEYGDMQLICECYHMMTNIGMSSAEIADVFDKWNQGVLDCYLLEISANILRFKDEETGKLMVDLILDTAGQKGTGKWTSIAGLDFGIPIPQIAEAVFARTLSAIKDERVAASSILPGPSAKPAIDKEKFVGQLHDAMYAAKVCSYAQGFQLIAGAAKEFNWSLNYGAIALMWRGGCIIRAAFLQNIKEAFDKKKGLANLLLDSYFLKVVSDAQEGWRNVNKTAIDLGVPTPSLSSALNYYDAYRCARLPANLLQAQRDYFGAHTYERTDKKRGEHFHSNWTGVGGTTASSTYNA